MFIRLIIAAAIVFSLPLAALCQAEADPEFPFVVSLLPGNIRQGDIVTVGVRAPMEVQSIQGRFNGRVIYFDKTEENEEFMGIVGIDMTLSPGRHNLLLEGDIAGREIKGSMVFDVKEREYEVEKLTFPGKMVELDRKSEERAEREAAILKGIWEKVSSERHWSGAFNLPVDGNLKPNFGRRRILNGREKNPHNGVDISAPEGETVASPNRGKVVLVDNHFFGGNTIVIDHGQGLFTAYLHLSEISVKEGDIVERGGPIGQVGETGRSKGPHLHWSARLHDARVDPLKLLDL